MVLALEALGVLALFFGLFFCAVGALGVMRMPNALTRLHASGKVATLGLFGILCGAALLMPSITLRVMALGLFVLLTSPVATHAIAASVYRRRELVADLPEVREQEVDKTAMDVSGILSRTALEDIIAAAEQRAAQAAAERDDDQRR